MATKDTWRKRVLAWRASGQRGDDFCAGQGFSPGLLRHWAWRLGMTRKRGGRGDGVSPVPLARVVRTCAPERTRGHQELIRIEIGRARIDVPAGVDVATLAAVVAVLAGRQETTEEQS
jgi:hypothetical protein